MKKAVVVQTDGNWKIVEFTNDNALAVLQKAVDGLIQPVDVRPNLTMWVNEEGLFRQDFDENLMASAIYEETFKVDQAMVGPAVYTGGTDEEGYTEGLDEQHLKLVVEMAKFHQQALERVIRV
jgi:hypothetical protein